MKEIGKKIWVIAEGYIPEDKSDKSREMMSHETACILNATERDANIDIMIYFSDRDPVGPYQVQVQSKRTKHLRFNDLESPEPVPKAVDYSSVITSDVPVIVQHTRLDSRSPDIALITTLAFSMGEC